MKAFKRNGLCHLAAVSLLLSLLVVEGLVPLVLGLPGVLEDGTEDGLKQQDAQVDDEERVHGSVAARKT